jgi:DNA-binding NtrC family response regulator
MTSTTPVVLIVEDDKNNLISLEKIFTRESLSVLTSLDGREALDIIRKQPVDVVLTDLMMPGMGGDELLKAIKSISPDIEVVLMTAYGTVETAVGAMKVGAYDFVEKPLKRAAIVKTVRKAIEKHSLVLENRSLKKRLQKFEKRALIGNSQVFRRTLDLATQAAPSMANILILGESGTGKELVARAIHDNSNRTDGPFVAVNCAALPETIMEAELFGFERGAFTGAVQQREGRFAQANKGTIFLDEVAEMSPSVQIKLLRVLQEGEFEPLGGTTVQTDVRVVAATNLDIEEEVSRGNFREDLFYRLNVIVVNMPPLRQRLEDVPLLTDHFLSLHASRNNKPVPTLTAEAQEFLASYYWPGNVRELENVIERAVVLCKNSVIGPDDLPTSIVQGEKFEGQVSFSIGTSLEEIELRMIKETLRHTKGDKKLAARLLGIAPRTIYRKLEVIDPPDKRGQ